MMTATATPLLTVRGVKTFYGKIKALRGVDIDVNQGEIVTLIGANGAGKSTLMMTICGTPRARDGHDRLRRRRHHPAADASRSCALGIAQSPEGRRIFPRMTVLENLQMGAAVTEPDIFERGPASASSRCSRSSKERQRQRGGTLSGGEQQMLAIARALMSRPRLLLLDEPSLGLAPLIVKQIFEVIRDLNREQGLTVFLVEQNAFHALKLAHRGYVMVNGSITMSGTGTRAAGARGSARRLSRRRAALRQRRHGQLLREDSLSRSSSRHRHPRRRRGLPDRPRRWRSTGGRSWHARSLYVVAACAALRFIHYALFDGTFCLPPVLSGRPAFAASISWLLIAAARLPDHARSRQMAANIPGFMSARPVQLARQAAGRCGALSPTNPVSFGKKIGCNCAPGRAFMPRRPIPAHLMGSQADYSRDEGDNMKKSLLAGAGIRRSRLTGAAWADIKIATAGPMTGRIRRLRRADEGRRRAGGRRHQRRRRRHRRAARARGRRRRLRPEAGRGRRQPGRLAGRRADGRAFLLRLVDPGLRGL